jgi:hypothetical protein
MGHGSRKDPMDDRLRLGRPSALADSDDGRQSLPEELIPTHQRSREGNSVAAGLSWAPICCP